MPLLELSQVKGVRNVNTNGFFYNVKLRLYLEKSYQKHPENFKVIFHEVLIVLLHLQNGSVYVMHTHTGKTTLL